MKLLLNDTETINVVGEVENGEEAIRVARELNPDIVLIDLNMPGMGGFEAVARLLRHKPSPLLQLNERELQILLMVVSGMKRGDIAKSLYLGKKTISGYVAKVLKKLGVKSDTDAVHMVMESDLLDGGT